MADAGDLPNQVSYEEVCTIAGRLFIESRYEIERLTSMLMEMQKKLAEEVQARLKAETALAETNKLLENTFNKGTS